MVLKLIIVNVLTLMRVIGTIILIPIYKNYGGFAVGILALVCYLTDSIDGILARKLKASTFFGALFDGAADKLFTIMSFIILYLITPYAIIPILFEIAIVFVQTIKYKNNLNVKSNIVGKLKTWVLALCVILTFLVSDINSITFIPKEFITWINNLNQNNLYFILLMPATIMEIITLLSYILEIFKPINKKAFQEDEKNKKQVNKRDWPTFKHIWLNPEFYNSHKDEVNLKDLTKLSK